MYCKNCGQQIEESEAFCKYCGTKNSGIAGKTASAGFHGLTAEQMPEQRAEGSVLPGVETRRVPGLDKKQFYERYAASRMKIRSAAIAAYIVIGYNLVLQLISAMSGNTLLGMVSANWISFAEILIFLGLTLWFHLAKSRVGAILCLAMGVAEMIFAIAYFGKPAGWMWLLIGAWAVMGTFQFQKEWKAYQKGEQQAAPAAMDL